MKILLGLGYTGCIIAEWVMIGIVFSVPTPGLVQAAFIAGSTIFCGGLAAMLSIIGRS